MSQAERNFYLAWRMAPLPGADLVAEYVFHPTRKWRFDFAFPSVKLAIEIQGAGRGGASGGHQSHAGMQRDCDKNNEAVRLGWRVLVFRAGDRKNALDWVRLVKEVLCQTV